MDAFRACCPDFDRLPAIIQRAHTGRIRLTGTVHVQRGSALASLLADILGMPHASDAVAMSVDGDHQPDCMIWNRQFGTKRFRSWFQLDGNRLIERVGPFHLRLALAARDSKLHYMLERVSLFGCPWPRVLAPSLEAWEGEADGRYDFTVEVRLPLIGRLVRYKGQMDHA